MMCNYQSLLSKPLSKKNEDIMANGYIYIIYPRNYDPLNIDTRLFYIGSAEDFEKRKRQHYQDLYNRANTSKRIILMRKYMKNINKDNIDKILDDDKIKPDDMKCWQIKPIFHGVQCCSKTNLETLEGLYIYYYYSILNDKAPNNFKFNDITQDQIDYFNNLKMDELLSSFYKKSIYFNINPFTLIHKDTCEFKPYRHIYKELCIQSMIIKFTSIEHLTKLIKIDKTINNITSIIKEPEIQEIKNNYYIKINDKCYKCFYCDKQYKFLNNYLVKHLKNIHNITVNN
jgi:hypothetical protein